MRNKNSIISVVKYRDKQLIGKLFIIPGKGPTADGCQNSRQMKGRPTAG